MVCMGRKPGLYESSNPGSTHFWSQPSSNPPMNVGQVNLGYNLARLGRGIHTGGKSRVRTLV